MTWPLVQASVKSFSRKNKSKLKKRALLKAGRLQIYIVLSKARC